MAYGIWYLFFKHKLNGPKVVTY